MTSQNVTRYVRYTDASGSFYGVLEGESIRQLEGDLFDNPRPTGKTVRVADVELGLPLDPRKVGKVIGVAAAYNNNQGAPPRVIPHPRWFAKLPSALNAHEGEVEWPPDATNLNFEGELVLVIGRQGRHLSVEEAPDYVFGVTVGNDWSENTWFGERQGAEEPSRLIAKSMDSWACLYHTIVTGLDYNDLAVEIRLNGELAAKGRTSEMTNSVGQLLAYLSHFVTMMPGDVIYTGTVNPPSLPGVRRPMKPGDVVEVEIEQIGTLRNTVVEQKIPVGAPRLTA